ncbi:PIG-L deacetylase family protein [Corynebacterium ulcerans]|uniref:PIG-L deacetylase family protein n=1 Tax=Corynebacterium ulcerans TaxID=65058 RepID=UPI000C77C72C|nr:hypothetical protein [Corynebacterium ulcerans]PLW01597.1 hypothetical protein BRL54_10160 [Corynebacterium ulcerans]
MATTPAGKRIMLLGVYGMEAVEVGGALLKNANRGGQSSAAIMLCGEEMRPGVTAACAKLKISVDYLGFALGEIQNDVAHKAEIVKAIRAAAPEVLITQDPEHSVEDFDPDRREAMNLILDSIALSARQWRVELGDPVALPEVYFMSPDSPNTIVSISDVWEEKQGALDLLESQLEFSAQHYDRYHGSETMEKIVPGWATMDNLERGKKSLREFNRALYLNNGSLGHGHFAFAEAYRKVGMFHVDHL